AGGAGGGAERREGDTVGVAIAAGWPERQHEMRPDTAQMRHDLGDRLDWVGLVEIAVDITEKIDLVQAEDLRGGAQLGLADRAQCGQPRVVFGRALPAALAARRRDQIRFDALRGLLLHPPPPPHPLTLALP